MEKDRKKKIAVITGSRADFGLITPVLFAIKKSKKLDLQLYITGLHLMPRFGKTANEVKRLFPKAVEIRAIFKNDERSAAADFSGILINKLVGVFRKNRPDFVLILGDRPEILSAALACLYLGIPIGHIHGGEKTTTVDESARHAITKLSQLHFPATKEASERIVKMGEESWRIKIVGAPALDTILHEPLPSRKKLFKNLGLNPDKPVILLIQHPVSEDYKNSGKQIAETIAAVKSFNLPVIAIYPNSDAGGGKMISEINKQRGNPNFHIFSSLPYKDFLALEREAAAWVGNSSAAIIESASFKTPVVNIGNRQSGRPQNKNIINVDYNREQIKSAVKKSLTDKIYLNNLKKIKNNWGDGKTGPRVAKILENLKINAKLLNKRINY
ncbi:UDP-N-acetylglucosamine 2-epimerase (hydrolyzing) [Candidatus Falkowbacteria bacterium]|nr:UDP-N-acetylglucosamine 2-epimerase (hydrolyzing) [Candidatus Falkowbacteria bacterium]